MKSIRKLLVTFDYELFLGKNSGSVDNCIIKPTDSVLALLNQYGIKAIFFIDTFYLTRLKEKAQLINAARADYEKIIQQLNTLIQSGHYLFPHIHPHWFDAKYNETTNSWQLNDLSKYRFHNLDAAMKEKIFSESMAFLEEIIMPIKPDYAIDSYRAGGWCIQPFEDFIPFFEKYGISNDFSVMPEIKSFTTDNYHDFRGAKRHIYFFDDNVVHEKDGALCEFPVSTIPVSALSGLIHKLETKILWKLNIRNKGDGNAAEFFSNVIDSTIEPISVDLMLLSKMNQYKKFVRTNNYIQIVSHPKMLSSYNITLFGRLLEYIYQNYSVTTDYKEMKPVSSRQLLNGV